LKLGSVAGEPLLGGMLKGPGAEVQELCSLKKSSGGLQKLLKAPALPRTEVDRATWRLPDQPSKPDGRLLYRQPVTTDVGGTQCDGVPIFQGMQYSRHQTGRVFAGAKEVEQSRPGQARVGAKVLGQRSFTLRVGGVRS
jgi:hypothetical protein